MKHLLNEQVQNELKITIYIFIPLILYYPSYLTVFLLNFYDFCECNITMIICLWDVLMLIESVLWFVMIAHFSRVYDYWWGLYGVLFKLLITFYRKCFELNILFC